MPATLSSDPSRTGQDTSGRDDRRLRWPDISSVSFVIPALDEEENIPYVMAMIPRAELAALGCATEVIVVDNASMDRTAQVAASLGATVVLQAARGYGNAYHAGLAAARGTVVVTGDADCTYPFDFVPQLLDELSGRNIDFLSTNRLLRSNRRAMKRSHTVGNHVLTVTSRGLFRSPFRDSQSGMWIFRRSIWSHLDVRSGGMQFSQEIKNEAWLKGFRCAEVPIEYRPRGGVVKLNALRDGTRNVGQLVGHRIRASRQPIPVRLLSTDVVVEQATEVVSDGLGGEVATEVVTEVLADGGSLILPLSRAPVHQLRLDVRDGHRRRAEDFLRRCRPWLVLVALVVVTLTSLAATPAGREQLALSFSRMPSPYVALAFPAATAEAVTQSGRELTMTFTVVGHDGAALSLPYEVDVSGAAGRHLASRTGTTTVAPEQPVQESVTVTLPDGGERWERVDVRLIGRAEAIHLNNPTADTS